VIEQPDINSPKAVSVIIPVYRDLGATRKCLESVFNSDMPSTASVTVINDRSPEPELSAYCRNFAAKAGWRFIENSDNLGFVKTANCGFALDPDADILLLNSDTEVSGDWLQRLCACAYRHTNIGTVTPFSNNGTICSYPVFPIANPIPASWTIQELDNVFRSANKGEYCEIPTAVGFCMFIKRSCLTETGFFDEINFGQGYGEECDFSLRASAIGWKNVIAADVFVYHEGAASFASESTDRKRRADEVMRDLHPAYHQLVSDFLQSDPLSTFRRNADAVRLALKPETSMDVLDEHREYASTLRARLEDFRSELETERKQKDLLQMMLDDCRIKFRCTDLALTEAQLAHDNAIKAIAELTDYLEDSRIYAEQLKEHINNMENSRSWRYTAWLRRK
jgi:GT2 family glycosyltransferase